MTGWPANATAVRWKAAAAGRCAQKQKAWHI